MPNFVDLLLDAVFLVDVHGRIVYVSAACERILGYTPEEMIGKTMIDFISPEDRARTREEASHVMAGHPRIGFENRYIRKDGSLANIMWSARWSEVDQLRVGVARDITERKRADAQQAAIYAISEAAHSALDLTALFREIHQIIAQLIPADGFAVGMCDEDSDLLGFPYQLGGHGDGSLIPEGIVLRICAEVIRGRKSMVIRREPSASIAGAEVSPSIDASWLAVPLFSQKATMGALIMKSTPGTSYTEKDKELLEFVSKQAAAAIERKQLHAELVKIAQFDELTGLPNRRILHDRMKIALARSRREEGRTAVLYIDLDDFKQVNDTLGHAAGDLLLQEVARRLKQCVREEDTVARLSGDEFVVLIERIHQSEDAFTAAHKIRTVVHESVTIDGKSLRMMPSVGIAFYPDHGDHAEQLMKHADQAMYLAKKQGKVSAAN
ncbi:diguanylate cyclase domain-containing protein [Noviherbaspirillum saxi]|uniref:Sensor domain-containing diguanylate cyclase n=1 Tax=Noviherbaspirillum saxi TaxID=2320863 RepID=A0A3A3FFD8_9BURK|nr:diguanylate cyclase [Noviherbaspirillum saxi]RJF92051.1 sensor domain-containing diguanylate cyclase [Noviherbaspirillum saxi]